MLRWGSRRYCWTIFESFSFDYSLEEKTTISLNLVIPRLFQTCYLFILLSLYVRFSNSLHNNPHMISDRYS